MDFWDKAGWVWTGIVFGIFLIIGYVYLVKSVLISAYRESTLQGRLCKFVPVYALYYAIKREWFDVKSAIKKFMKAGAARNVQAAYACWSPQSVTEEEIADFIRGRYDLFADYDRMHIIGTEENVSEDIEGCYARGDVTYTGGKKLPLGVQLIKENKGWKITGIRIGSTEKGRVARVSTDIEAGPVNRNS